MKRILKIITLIISGIIISIVPFYFFYLKDARDNKLIKEGELLKIKVENYKKEHHKLPESLLDLGIVETMEGPLYYQKRDSLNYIIWYGKSLGESNTYHSDSQKWEDRDR